jgi:hypothetical protein
MIGYLARYTKPWLLYSYCRLTRFVKAWEQIHDFELQRLVRGLDNCALRMIICPSECNQIKVVQDVDADYAGCPLTRVSTMGCSLLLTCDKRFTDCFIHTGSKTIKNHVKSTGEAELCGLGKFVPQVVNLADALQFFLLRGPAAGGTKVSRNFLHGAMRRFRCNPLLPVWVLESTLLPSQVPTSQRGFSARFPFRARCRGLRGQGSLRGK